MPVSETVDLPESPQRNRGLPFVPPQLPGAPPLDPVAMALRDPELIAASTIPYLPPPVKDPTPASAPAVFDARAMVEATRRKVDNPVYGQIPKGTPESRAAMDAARVAMRRKRRRNTIVGRVTGLVFLAALVGGGYLVYRQYQSDQNEPSLIGADDGGGAGALTPIGEQAAVVDALDSVNSGITPSAGEMMTNLVEAAEAAVGQDSGQGEFGPPDLLVAEMLPSEIVAVADVLEPVDGYGRYVVDVATAEATAPSKSAEWIGRLQTLAQAPPDSAGLSVLPPVESGEIAIAVQTSADRVVHIVALGPGLDIRVDR